MSRGPLLRLFFATTAASLWLFALLVGWLVGGAVHLLLLVAAVIFPYGALPPPVPADDEPPPAVPSSSTDGDAGPSPPR